MDSPSFKQQLSPSKTPLFPASPERMNQQRLANSLSMPSDLGQKSSDVQSKIAFLNNLSRESLSRAGSPAPSQQTASAAISSASAALQRAILGREEAESALVKASTQLSDAQSRERRISERLESLLEELQTTRERQAHERTLFEKEVRKARKEAFRAGSLLVKAQEELKLSREEIKNLKGEVRTERDSKERAKQESFERAYALAGMSEELQSLKDQLRAIEADNQTSVLESQAEDVEASEKQAVDYADQATCTTPTPRRPKRSADALELLQVASSSTENYTHKEETPTKKMRLSRRVSNKENQDPDMVDYQGDLISELKEEIKFEQRQRQRAEDMVHFMKMECQFKRCSCRVAESQGHKYVHDKEWDSAIYVEEEDLHVDAIEEQEHAVREETPATSVAQSPLGSSVSAMTPPTPQYQEPSEPQKTDRPPRQSEVAFCEVTGTFVQVSPPHSPPHAHMHDRPSEEPLVLPRGDDDDDDETEIPHEAPEEKEEEFAIEEHVSHQPSYDDDFAIEEDHYEAPDEQPLETHRPDPVNTHIASVIEQHRASERLPITPIEQATVVKEESITKTVPIQFESKHARNPSDIIPGTPLTREEALAQIRARRGRTKSTTQRSVSATEATARGGAGGMKVPPSRRIPGVKSSGTRSEPDVAARRDTAPAPVSRRY